jgi:predicted dehydrogenase
MCDVDVSAMSRTRDSIYPSRYGTWDAEIGLFEVNNAPSGGYDLIFIGTPPDSHLPLALEALNERPKAILIEKPVCSPGLEHAQEFLDKARSFGVEVFVGYDHVVGRSTRAVEDSIKKHGFSDVTTIDVEFREHWGGIFDAHPWLTGPTDSYLGFSSRGGGASGEHSHGINLWQHLASYVGAGRVTEVQAMLDFVVEGDVYYDRICALNLKTEKGLVGRCLQDVVTKPARKWAKLQFTDGAVECFLNKKPGVDYVQTIVSNGERFETSLAKSRPEDFIQELQHIVNALSSEPEASPIHILRGMETMLVVAAAHLSHKEGKTVLIDYSLGFGMEALSLR